MAQPQFQRREEDIQEIPAQPRNLIAYAQDQVRWWPILAGVVVALVTIVVLSTLGIALGLTNGGPDGEPGTAFAWGATTAFVALFMGGFTAGCTASVSGPAMGIFNGAMVWALSLVVTLLLVALGAGAAFGLMGAVGVDFNVDAQTQGQLFGIGDQVWWTFVAMLVGLGAAALGGYLGGPKHATLTDRSERSVEEIE